MQTFTEALEKFQELDPKEAFAQIFRFFEAINRMDKESTIAAMQTLQVFGRKTDRSLVTDSDLSSVRSALIGRMNVLCGEVAPEQRLALVAAFIAATDLRPIYFQNVIQDVKQQLHLTESR